jgi:catechol 2,3-dioxygenase-like lactoylglutathione lyase family enzyme
MMRIIRQGLVLTGAALMAASVAAAPSDGTITRRTTLLVHDLDRSVDFYRTLGFEKWYEGANGTVNGQGLPVVDAKIGDPTKLVIMKGKDPYVGMIGLLQYGPKRPLPTVGEMRAGDSILMIETKGMDAIAKKLQSDGYRIQKPPETSHIKSVGAAWDAKFMYVFDPDGRMVELTERLN